MQDNLPCHIPCYLTKCILLESRAIFPFWVSPVEYLRTHGAAVKLFSGEPQPEPIFGFFMPADGGVRKQ